jgi:hypothetical protein
MKKAYIGDGVYAEPWEWPGGVRLTTEDGYRITNVIVLEPEVLEGLRMYLEAIKAEIIQATTTVPAI